MDLRRLARGPFGRLTLLAAAVCLPMLGSAASAEEDADLDLKPADFSPDETVAIRVEDLHPGAKGSEVVVTVANRTSEAVTATVECSLFDGEREDLGTASGIAKAIAAGSRVRVIVVAPAEGAKRAYCRIARKD